MTPKRSVKRGAALWDKLNSRCPVRTGGSSLFGYSSDLVFHASQGFAELIAEQRHREDHRKSVSNQLGQIDGSGLIAHQVRHQIDQRDQQEKLAQHGHNDGTERVPRGDERHLTGRLRAKNEPCAAAEPQVMGGKVDPGAVAGEDLGKQSRERDYTGPEHNRIDHTRREQEPKTLFYAPGVPRAEVVAGDRLCAPQVRAQQGKLHDARQNRPPP